MPGARTWQDLAGDLREMLLLPREEEDISSAIKKAGHSAGARWLGSFVGFRVRNPTTSVLRSKSLKTSRMLPFSVFGQSTFSSRQLAKRFCVCLWTAQVMIIMLTTFRLLMFYLGLAGLKAALAFPDAKHVNIALLVMHLNIIQWELWTC